jgi:hypothetical protein
MIDLFVGGVRILSIFLALTFLAQIAQKESNMLTILELL